MVIFDQEDHAIISEIYMWGETFVSHSYSQESQRAKFAEELIVGDSGNAGFVIIDGKPILVLTHYDSANGPNFSTAKSDDGSSWISKLISSSSASLIPQVDCIKFLCIESIFSLSDSLIIILFFIS
jgi:hypothetical protein